MNLMTKYGQTTNYTAKDHVHDLERYTGTLDAIVINTKKPAPSILKKYEKAQEVIVKDDYQQSDNRIIRSKVMDEITANKSKGDFLRRSVIRHSPSQLAKKVISLL